MSPSDKPAGEVTDTVDSDDFGDPDEFGSSSTDGLGSSTGNVTGNVDIWTAPSCARQRRTRVTRNTTA